MTDHGLVLSLVPGYTAPMEPAEMQFVEWMREQFRLRPDLSQSDLARHLNIHRNIVYKMLKGQRKRGITVSERAAIQEFFGAEVAFSTLSEPSTLGGGITVKGRIAPHIWETDGHAIDDTTRIGSPVLDYPLSEQIAYELAASSQDGEFRRYDYVYTVPFANYRAKLLPDDLVIVARRRPTLIGYDLALAVASAAGIVLRPVLDGPARDLADGEVIGLVIGTFRPRPRR